MGCLRAGLLADSKAELMAAQKAAPMANSTVVLWAGLSGEQMAACLVVSSVAPKAGQSEHLRAARWAVTTAVQTGDSSAALTAAWMVDHWAQQSA